MRFLKWLFLFFILPLMLLLSFSANWVISLYQRVEAGLASNKFLQISEIYSAPIPFRSGEYWTQLEIIQLLQERDYRQRPAGEALFDKDFTQTTSDLCLKEWPELSVTQELMEPACLRWKTPPKTDPDIEASTEYALVMGIDGRLVAAGPLREGASQAGALIDSMPIAQYLEGTPLHMKWAELGQIPSSCSNAVLAIEDAAFLEHVGVSPEALLRALYKNVLRGGSAQGGSTITQQLVKNYFLTPEKTLKRKLTEFFMALSVERLATKDQILESYLNIIYLGQSGVFQIRGYGAASEYYFQKPISEMDISDCALLAAILNSPGLYDPFRHPDRAFKRRERVLERMKELNFISEKELAAATAKPLPSQRPPEISQTAPYFIEAVLKQVEAQGHSTSASKVYSTLDVRHQSWAQNVVNEHLKNLETGSKKILKLKAAGLNLEGVLLSMDNQTGWITAAVGGRNYRKSQFNRITDSKRQIGSLMKPFVFLSAFRSNSSLNPLSLIMDEQFTHKWEGQSWSPINYDKKFYGEIPMYYALKKSLNSATAALGLKVGLEGIIEVAQLAGLESRMDPSPSLTLGAFEMSPVETLVAYSTLARMGRFKEPIFLRALVDERGDKVYQNISPEEERLPALETAMVVSMLRENNKSGTGAAVSKSGLKVESAGKTGTTNDSKDAWYAGFTPDRTTLVWVGYDRNESHGLTGSSGALPAWIQFMEKTSVHDAHQQFAWPEDTELETIRNLDETEDAEVLVRESFF